LKVLPARPIAKKGVNREVKIGTGKEVRFRKGGE